MSNPNHRPFAELGRGCTPQYPGDQGIDQTYGTTVVAATTTDKPAASVREGNGLPGVREWRPYRWRGDPAKAWHPGDR